MYSSIANPSSSPAQLTPLGTSHPLEYYITYDNFSPKYRTFIVAITSHNEPEHYIKVVQDPHWREAMAREISNNTWEYDVLPPGKRAPSPKWVYKIKDHANGTFERYKARLVVLGNTQVEGGFS